MTTPFRLKLLSSCVGAAIAQAGAPALADSAVGVNTMLGNALNPTTINQLQRLDPEGLDARTNTRTPTGQQYDWDPLPREQRTSSSGWIYSGAAEAGGIGVFGDDDSAWFEQYKDLETGLYLNNFWFKAHNPDSAYFFDGVGGALGYRDQFFGFKFGRYNDWYGKLFYQETPHTFTSRYRPLWTEKDDADLKLGSLAPAASTNPEIAAEIEATGFTDLKIVRRQGGLTLEKYLTDSLKLLGSYSLERREGSRPFGAVFGNRGGTGGLEIPEAIDYDTHDIWAALRYEDGVNSANLTVTGSLFRNNNDTQTFENPVIASTDFGFDPVIGKYDLYPDNDYWNIKGEYARLLPDFYDGRFTALASFSTMKQDDDLIPWTPFGPDAFTGLSDGAWNTTASLTQDSADAEIDTMLFDVGLSLRPTDKLGVKGKIRYYETDNKTDFVSCNPQTGEWGRLGLDGGRNGLDGTYTGFPDTYCNQAATRELGIVPANGITAIRTVPFDYSKLNYVLGGDYRLTPASTLTANLEREEIDRNDKRERDTWENSLKLTYVNRGFSFGTLRLSADYGERRGDDYLTNPYEEYLNASLGPLPTNPGDNLGGWLHAVNDMRKFDLADRNRLNLNGRLNMIAADAMDIGLTLNYKDDAYPDSDLGRTDHHWVGSGTIDVNYQPSERLGLYGFYTYQQSHMEQSNVSSNGGGSCVVGSVIDGAVVTAGNWRSVCANVSPNNPTWPTLNVWSVEGEERNNVFGFGGTYDLGVALLSLDYSFIDGVYDNDQSYNAVAQGFTAEQVAYIGDGFPNYEYSQHILDLSAFFPISKTLGIRALYRYEKGSIDDWHYDGVVENPVPGGGQVSLDAGLDDYSTSVVGLFVHMSF